MRLILILCMAFILCTTIFTPVLAVTTNGMDTSYGSTDGYITRHYDYVLNRNLGTVPLALSTKLYDMYRDENPREDRDWGYTDNTSFFLTYLNERNQNRYFEDLADEIRKKEDNPDDQARIAISLVQHIPYIQGSPYSYPYEVFYDGSGLCFEKSLLLGALLRELGYKSSVMYFMTENHMAVGISCPEPYDFRGTGYCLVQATNSIIMTDETPFAGFGESWSSPEIIRTQYFTNFSSMNL